eukprot:403359870
MTERAQTVKGRLSIPLRLFCPKSFAANGCEKKILTWQWKSCEHQTYVNDQGDCLCLKCNKEHFIQNVAFHCGERNHGNDYEAFSASDFLIAIGIALASIDNSSVLASQKRSFSVNINNNVNDRWKD